MRLFTEEYLAHHGILGQKWGQRNGPPYPLDESKHSKAEQSLAAVDSIVHKYSDTELRNMDTSTGASYVKSKWWQDKERNSVSNNDHSIRETLYIRDIDDPHNITAYEVGRDIALILQNHGTLDGTLYGNRNGPEDYATAAKNANPYYGENGTTNNCMKCGAVVELRRRGIDVTAGRSMHGTSAFTFESWFKGAKTKGYGSLEEMRKDLLKQGDGASGVLQGFYGDGMGSGDGGHTVHWSVNGRHLEIQDGQTGETFSSFDSLQSHYKFNPGNCCATRLDNCEPDYNAMNNDAVVSVPPRENWTNDSFGNRMFFGWMRVNNDGSWQYYDRY